jgi:signal transduction histidine kinase/ActR/RegA family two-component response regulator
MSGLSPQQLLHHAQQLVTLGSPAEILAASCRGVLALTGGREGFATFAVPGQPWERGQILRVAAETSADAGGPAKSALFAIHRRLAARPSSMTLARDEQTEAIFRGLGCGADVTTIAIVPLVHRTGRLWGELVLVGDLDPHIDGVAELAQLTHVALENAQRIGFARRDQDRLMLLSEATDDALWDWNIDTREFWWGAGIVKLLGAGRDPIENTVRWKLSRIHDDDRARVEASLDATLLTAGSVWTAEYRFERTSGDYLQIEDRAYFLRDAQGRAYRVIGAMRDVTAMKSLLEREHRARAEAENASRAKDEFLAMLGHELRNPLAPIITGLQLMRMRGAGGLERELTIVERQAQHLIRLVDDLLDISRISHGKVELKKARLEAGSVIAAAIEMASPLIEERRHTLEVAVPSRGLELDADRGRLAQAVSNLLMNAAKYTEPGGRITIRAQRDGDSIAIIIRDTGIGIAPEMLPRVFNMFEQERQALDRARGGLGLGLSIVRSLVTLHGGTVEPFSAGRGQGSEFTIRLPAAASIANASHAASAAAAKQRTRGRRIMVVDDNADAADLLSSLLEGLGNTICVAHDASGALSMIDEFQPDLAVLDIGLPVMDGFELARRLRERPATRAVRLIALSGYAQPSDQRRATDAGFDAHLAKPIEIDALDAVIQRLLPGPLPETN